MTLDELTALIATKDIAKVQEAFTTRTDDVAENLKQYGIQDHAVTKREDKRVTDKKGETKYVKQWKIPIPYQKKIVESAVAFLFGKPVRLIQESEGTDEVFGQLQDLWKDMRMHALNRETARILFSESEVARLYLPYRDADAPKEDITRLNKVRCVLLAQSKGDTLYTNFDIYGRMQAFGRKYQLREGDKDIEHFDIYTADTIYACTKATDGWEVVTESNPIGKIPVAYYKQDATEWADVQPMIERLEWLMSTRADVNDYSANPILILEGEIIDLPEKHEVAKVVRMEAGGKASYLTPQMAIEMVKDERETLEEAIKFCTDTPDMSQKEEKTIGQQSGIALVMKFFPAILKAANKQELWGEMLDREINILKAFMGVFKFELGTGAYKSQLINLQVGIEFGNPLPDNVEERLNMLSLATGSKPIMSQKTAIGLNPLVADPEEELKQLQEEEAESKVTLGF